MDLYHIWFNLKSGTTDLEICDRLDAYLGALVEAGEITSYRVSRRKLGLGPPSLGEFHVVIEVRDLAQLDSAFTTVSSRADPVESLHAEVNQSVRDVCFALYRDFPDPQRVRGEERF